MSDTQSVLEALMETIKSRRDHPPERSYTTTLFRGGPAKIGEKIVEEAAEVVEAGTNSTEADHANLVHEAADLIYHLFVMLGHRHVELAEVTAELQKRFNISGLDEKESRPKTE